VSGAAVTYRLLCFQNNVLVEWEVLPATEAMEAIELASSRAPHLTVELWSDRKKIAVFKPAGTRHRV
jgi:hypothetical protein